MKPTAIKGISLAEGLRRLRAVSGDMKGGIPPFTMKKLAKRVIDGVRDEAAHNVSGFYLNVRSGTLRRYIIDALTRNTSEVEDGFVMGLPKSDGRLAAIAAMHDLGPTTIMPKGHPYLRIPIGPALTKKGVDKFAGWTFREKAPTEPRLFFHMAKSGKAYLVESVKAGRHGSKLIAWYALRESVVIPRRPWFTEAVKYGRRNVKKWANELIAERIGEAVR